MSESRIVTFSIKPSDESGLKDVDLLKSYSETSGVSFSHIMIRAMDLVKKELKVHDN